MSAEQFTKEVVSRFDAENFKDYDLDVVLEYYLHGWGVYELVTEFIRSEEEAKDFEEQCNNINFRYR